MFQNVDLLMTAGLNVLFDEDNKMKMDKTETNERVNSSLVGVRQFWCKWTETKLVITKNPWMSSSPAVYGRARSLQPHPVPAHHKERWLPSYYPRRRNREAFLPLHTCACSSHKRWPLMIVQLHPGMRHNGENSTTSWIWTPGSSSDRRLVL